MTGSASYSGSAGSGSHDDDHSTHHGEHGTEQLFLLAPIAALVVGSMIRRCDDLLPVPYTVMLLLVGLFFGALQESVGLGSVGDSLTSMASMDAHTLLYVFLPPLLFESGMSIELNLFRKVAGSCISLAGPGLLVSAGVTGCVVKALLYPDWSWETVLLFGCILSATDPVAVVALLKELGAKKSLSTFIEGESLLNDGTAVVIFVVLLEAVQDGGLEMGAGEILLVFVKMSVGGVAFGVLMAHTMCVFLKGVFNDAMIESTVTIAMAYLTFFVAEYYLRMSGVLALVALGVYFGSVGRTCVSPEVQHFLHEFWLLMAYIANTLVFLQTGLVLSIHATEGIEAVDVVILLALYATLTVARGIMFAVCYPLFKPTGFETNARECFVAVWGGLRGAVGLALALVVALDQEVDSDIGHRFLFHVGGIVLLTLLLNATSIKRVLSLLGLSAADPNKEYIFALACKKIAAAGAAKEAALKLGPMFSTADWEEVANYEFRVADTRARLAALAASTMSAGKANQPQVQHAQYSVHSALHRKSVSVPATVAEGGAGGGAAPVQEEKAEEPAAKATTLTAVAKQKLRDAFPSAKRRAAGAGANVVAVGDAPSPHVSSEEVAGRQRARFTLLDNFVHHTHMVETHRRFLVAVKASYNKQFDEGLLSRSAFVHLTHATDAALDCGCHLNEWDELGQYLTLEGTVISWLSGFFEHPLLGPVLQHQLFTHLQVGYDIGSGFLTAREDAIELMSSFLADLERLSALKEQVKNDTERARAALLDVQMAFPEVSARIATHLAARTVLNNQRHTVHDLHHDGLLDETEAQRMSRAIEGNMKRLNHRPPTSAGLGKEQLLRSMQWLQAMGADVLRRLRDAARERPVNKGEMIIEMGDDTKAVFIVARGALDVLINDVVVDQIGVGRIVGELAFLTGQPRVASVRARSPGIILELTFDDMTRIVQAAPQLHRAMWKRAASEMAENLLVRFSPYAGRTRRQLRRELEDWALLYPAEIAAKGTRFATFRRHIIVISGTCRRLHKAYESEGEVNALDRSIRAKLPHTILRGPTVVSTKQSLLLQSLADAGSYTCSFSEQAFIFVPPHAFVAPLLNVVHEHEAETALGRQGSTESTGGGTSEDEAGEHIVALPERLPVVTARSRSHRHTIRRRSMWDDVHDDTEKKTDFAALAAEAAGGAVISPRPAQFRRASSAKSLLEEKEERKHRETLLADSRQRPSLVEPDSPRHKAFDASVEAPELKKTSSLPPPASPPTAGRSAVAVAPAPVAGAGGEGSGSGSGSGEAAEAPGSPVLAPGLHRSL